MRSGGLLRTVARFGRMTCEDAAELATVFAQVASRQARDTVVALRSRVDRGRGSRDAVRGRSARDDRPR